MIVGDDVALGIYDEAGAKGLTNLAVVAAFRIRPARHLAAKELVEEVLEVALALPLLLILVLILVVVARILRRRLHAAVRVAVALVFRLFGQGLRVDVHDRRTNLPRDLDELVGRNGGIDDFKRCGVGAVGLLLLPADSVSGEGTGHNGSRESGKQHKY